MNGYTVRSQFIKYLRAYWPQELIVLVLLILGTISSLAPPYLMMIIVDEVFPFQDYELLLLVLLTLLGITAFGVVSMIFVDYLYSWVSNQIMLDMRVELFNHLMQVPTTFFRKAKTGDIIYRINNEVDAIHGMISSSMLRLVHNLFTLIGLAILLCWLNYQLFIFSLIIVPFFLLNIRFFQPRMRHVAEAGQKRKSDLLSFFKERFDNIRLVQSYNGYEHEHQELRRNLGELIDINMRGTVYSSSMRSISGFLISMTPLIVFGWGGHQVMSRAMTVGSVIAFFQYLLRIFGPIQDMNSLYMDFVRASVSIRRILEFKKIPTQGNGTSTRGVPFSFLSRIVFHQVEFGFDGRSILKGFDLVIERGKKYAIIGSSGCGKTTITNLLCRFYEPDSGTILIDDIPLQTVDLFDLRSKIALVLQEDLLFHDTIRENIRYGNWQTTSENVEDAATVVGLREYAAGQKEGLDTLVGDQGTQLSGGQRQRISIARAIVKDAEVLIMDEATSALDIESERMIFSNICRSYRDKTIVIISHRHSAFKDVDEVIRIDEGKVVAKGKPEAML